MITLVLIIFYWIVDKFRKSKKYFELKDYLFYIIAIISQKIYMYGMVHLVWRMIKIKIMFYYILKNMLAFKILLQ